MKSKKNIKYQIEEMREWFSERYEDPVHHCPHDGREGGYLYIFGGPYDARDILENTFREEFSEKAIEELIEELEGECFEWSKKQTVDDFYQDELDSISFPSEPLSDLLDQIENSEKAILELKPDQEAFFHHLVFIHTITILETFLSDYFISKITISPSWLKSFVQNNRDLSERKFSLSEIYETHNQILEIAKKYLLSLIWHNLSKIEALYKCTFKISFPQKSPGNLRKAIIKRHDLVHRNGKDKDGNLVSVTKNELTDLLQEVRDFACDLNSTLEKLTVPEAIENIEAKEEDYGF
ncbi:MAG: hypothetical protein CVV41_16215 [Candidatus Riflebacteria bacterium HGW-Riflebacteria-1]|jgi:hypothetical protein|nr:MAG: hypothetical protein CVV41_16215 [Candidatus Riflebacteria bacterium HGW-Riflebacteria-1]